MIDCPSWREQLDTSADVCPTCEWRFNTSSGMQGSAVIRPAVRPKNTNTSPEAVASGGGMLRLPPLPAVTELNPHWGSRSLLVVDFQYLTRGAKDYRKLICVEALLDRARSTVGPEGHLDAIGCFLLVPHPRSQAFHDALVRIGFDLRVVHSWTSTHQREDVDLLITRAILQTEEYDQLILVTGDHTHVEDITWLKSRRFIEVTLLSYPSSTSRMLADVCNRSIAIGADLFVSEPSSSSETRRSI